VGDDKLTMTQMILNVYPLMHQKNLFKHTTTSIRRYIKQKVTNRLKKSLKSWTTLYRKKVLTGVSIIYSASLFYPVAVDKLLEQAVTR
jgi:hypothetical protein